MNTVLFDLDGTLVQHSHVLLPPILAEWGEARTLDAVTDAFARQILWFYDHVADAELHGWVKTLWIRFYGHVLDDLGIPDTDHSRATWIYAFFEENPVPPLYPDVPEVLTSLSSAGWKMGIITQRSRAGACRFLTSHDLLARFPVVIAGDDGHGRKPDAAPFLTALDKLDTPPDKAVFVGDRIDDDCEGALSAGLGAFLIDREGLHSHVDHTDAGYTALNHLSDLLGHLPLSAAQPQPTALRP